MSITMEESCSGTHFLLEAVVTSCCEDLLY